MVFDERWFKQNQWWLLPYVSHDRDNLFIGTNKPLVEIAPDHVSWLEEPGLITTEFHVHHVYGRRLYQRLSPLWNLMHRIDMSSWGRATGLNFGFDTLTAYPDAHAETNTVDGFIQRSVTQTEWATIHDAADGTLAQSDITYGDCVAISAGATSPNFKLILRGIFLFDTSSIGANTISAATLSFYKYTMTDYLYTPCDADIVSSAPASDTDLAVGDYDALGTTEYGAISIEDSAAGYNNGALNASGLSAIARSGITKFGTLMDKDRENSAPTWGYNKSSRFQCYFSDDTTANNGKDPKLVVTYTAASTFIPKCIFL